MPASEDGRRFVLAHDGRIELSVAPIDRFDGFSVEVPSLDELASRLRASDEIGFTDSGRYLEIPDAFGASIRFEGAR